MFDVNKYRQAIGSLIYLMTSTRPDISYRGGILSKYMHQPRQLHWYFVIRLSKYIKTTQDNSLEYSLTCPEKPKLTGFSVVY